MTKFTLKCQKICELLDAHKVLQWKKRTQVDGLNDCLVLEDFESEGFLPLPTFLPPTTSLLAHVHAMLRALAVWHALSLRWP